MAKGMTPSTSGRKSTNASSLISSKKSAAEDRLLKKYQALKNDSVAINIVKYDVERGVGVKTVEVPQLQGAKVRFTIKPLNVVASDLEVYMRVLDVIYPSATSSEKNLDLKNRFEE